MDEKFKCSYSQEELDAKFNTPDLLKRQHRVTVESMSFVKQLNLVRDEEFFAHPQAALETATRAAILVPGFVKKSVIDSCVRIVNNMVHGKDVVTEADAGNMMKLLDKQSSVVRHAIIDERSKGHDVKTIMALEHNIVVAKTMLNKHAHVAMKAAMESATVPAIDALRMSGTALGRFLALESTEFENEDAYDDALVEGFKEVMAESAEKAGLGEPPKKDDNNNTIPQKEKPKEEPKITDDDIKKPQRAMESLRESMTMVADSKAAEIIKGTFGLRKCINREFACAPTREAFVSLQSDDATVVAMENTGVMIDRVFKKRVTEACDAIGSYIESKDKGFTVEPVWESDKTVQLKLVALESITSKGETAVRKTVQAARSVVPNEGPVKKLERITEPLDNIVNNTIDDIRDVMKNDKRDEIIGTTVRVKLVRVITKCLAVGAAYAIHPALAAIGVLGKLIHDKRVDQKERNKIVRDLKDEREIVEAKIKDAEAKGDNENKYKLMRIRQKLDRTTARIEFNRDND